MEIERPARRGGIRAIAQGASSGMSLIELVLALGMLGIVAVGVGQMMTGMSRGQKGVAVVGEIEDLKGSIRLRLSNHVACQAMLTGQPVAAAVGASSDIAALAGVAASSSNVGSLRVGQIKLKRAADLDAYTDAGVTYQRILAELSVPLTKPQGASGGAQAVTVTQSLVVATTAGAPTTIATCHGDSSPTGVATPPAAAAGGLTREEACADLGGTYSATTTPKCILPSLTVAGALKGGSLQGAPVCRKVNDVGNAAPYYIATAKCAADEYVMTGGALCEVPGGAACVGTGTLGVLIHSGYHPNSNSWKGDCVKYNGMGEACSVAWAICCKK
jgi:hypothetical protein